MPIDEFYFYVKLYNKNQQKSADEEAMEQMQRNVKKHDPKSIGMVIPHK